MEWIIYQDAQSKWRSRDLRLVHCRPATRPGRDRRCRFDFRRESAKDGGIIGDLPLREFQGVEGLMRLLRFLHEDEFPRHSVLEMIKRIHIPGYERARPYFDQALSEGVIEPTSLLGYYSHTTIQVVLDHYERKR